MNNSKVSIDLESQLFFETVDTHLAPKEAVRRRVLDAAAPARRPVRPKRGVILIATLIGALLLATSAVAATVWIVRNGYTPEQYMIGLGSETTQPPIADVENAIAAAAPADAAYTIRLLPELTDAETYANWREKMGQPAFSEEDWGWLRAVVPSVGEVLLDGTQLLFNTVLTTDHAASFAYQKANETQQLDALTDGEMYYTVEGSDQKHPLACTMTGLNPNLDTANSVTCLSSVEELPEDFPTEGLVTFYTTIRVYDCRVDPMANIATIALIDFSFTVDAGAGAAARQETHMDIPLMGSYVLTVRDGQALYNKRVDLAGVVLDARVQYLSTGVYLTLTVKETPDDWSEAEKAALLQPNFGVADKAGPGSSVAYNLFGKNEEDAEPGYPGTIPFGELPVIFPVFPSDYDTTRIGFSFSIWCADTYQGAACGDDWRVEDWDTNALACRQQLVFSETIDLR